MQYFIGYRTAYDYVNESYNQSSSRTVYGDLKYQSWDGVEPFLDVLSRTEKRFVKRARGKNSDGDHNFRFEITDLKIAGLRSSVTMKIEKQIVPIE